MKAVITCGGLGSRLLPFTKELPKEMAPIFFKEGNEVEIKPLIQLIYERLYDEGIREFCFITGKTKRSIENHFTLDTSNSSTQLRSFFKKLKDSKIFWVTQNSPNGFGDALRYAESFVGSEYFILQAGDVAFLQNKINLIKKLIEFAKNKNCDAVLSIRKVSDPKRHGIVTLKDKMELESNVIKAVEKPESPESNLGIMPIYMFNHFIFKYLQNLPAGKNNEIQLTDAIQKMIEEKKNVKAIRVDEEEFWDVGTPEAYWSALNESHLNVNKSRL